VSGGGLLTHLWRACDPPYGGLVSGGLVTGGLVSYTRGSGSGISWAMCKSAPRSRQMTTPALHHSFSTGWMPFLPPNQQRQSTEDKKLSYKLISKSVCLLATVDDHLKQLQ